MWTAAVVLFSVLLVGCSSGEWGRGVFGNGHRGPARGAGLRSDGPIREVSFARAAESREESSSSPFLYTYCPDICPIVAHHVKGVSEGLGDDAAEVSIVVVSVDPGAGHGRAGAGVFRRLGNGRELGVSRRERGGAQPSLGGVLCRRGGGTRRGRVADVPEEWKVDRVRGVDALSRDIASRYTVAHQAPVYLIDKQGRVRVLAHAAD